MINVDGWMLVLNLEVKENDLLVGHLQQRTMEPVTIVVMLMGNVEVPFHKENWAG